MAQPGFSPNTVNQHVQVGNELWIGNPGGGWQMRDPGVTAANDAKAATAAQAASDKAATEARFTQGKQDLTDFNSRFSTAAPKIINDTSAKYNLGALLDASNTSTGDLRTSQYNIGNTGAGGYASQGQVDNVINKRLSPKQSLDAENYLRGTTAAQNEEQMLFTPYQVEAQGLNERLTREATGYNAEQQRELEGLLGSINAGVQLTGQQIAQATELAKAEKAYQQAIDQQKISSGAVKLSSGDVFKNLQSGQVWNPYQV